ncbi:MAG: aminotransferase class III-fold pyridoxal phosphate-dependent enzyme [Acetobacteraceae bacterium]|nr:aminotransferase class III-fold pyridoxal phosphate-dependent enzyme [Acetobacteraceae bacterium]
MSGPSPRSPNPGVGGDLVNQALSDYDQCVNPGLAWVWRFMGLETLEWQAQGAVVRDIHGREYVDFAGGYGVFTHGHRHPRVVEAVRRQLDMMPLSSRVLPSHLPARVGRLLAQITPGDLQYSFFCNSGAEAVEGALKFARVATGRSGFVATQGAFHGKTLGALSASGREVFRRPFEPLVPGFTHVPFGDAAALEAAVDENTAAVILEVIQGEGGVILPPDDYLTRARRACDRAGALLILDEVQTGLGRTGRMFACEHYGVVPDLLCLAKALGGGVMPIGAVVGRPPVWEFFRQSPLLHTSTFGGNPLACAAAVAAIEVILEEDYPRQAREKGEYLLNGLKELAGRYPSVVSEVRGLGLLIGLEVTREGAGGLIMSGLFDRGVLAVYTLNNQKVIRIEPPVVIDKDQMDRGLELLDQVLAEVAGVVDQL